MSTAPSDRQEQNLWDDSDGSPAALDSTRATALTWEEPSRSRSTAREPRESPEPDLSAPDEGLPIYLREIGSVCLLTPDEEKMLAEWLACGKEARRRLQAGEVLPEEQGAAARLVARGEDARRRMIEANLRLVVSMCMQSAISGQLL